MWCALENNGPYAGSPCNCAACTSCLNYIAPAFSLCRLKLQLGYMKLEEVRKLLIALGMLDMLRTMHVQASIELRLSLLSNSFIQIRKK